MHVNETWLTLLSGKAVQGADSPGYVALSEKPEVLKTQPEEMENAQIRWATGEDLRSLKCFVG